MCGRCEGGCISGDKCFRRNVKRGLKKDFAGVTCEKMEYFTWRSKCKNYTLVQQAMLDELYIHEAHPADWLRSLDIERLSFKELADMFIDRLEDYMKVCGQAMTDTQRKKMLEVISFIKAEQYPEYKHSRCINGRSDYAKILFGRVIKALEEVIYQHSDFIKKVPVDQRPSYLWKKFERFRCFFEGDYSSFECSFLPPLVRCTEYVYLKYFLGKSLADFFTKSIYANNKCVFIWFTVFILARRMSGDVNTSSGNGICNREVIKYIYYCATGKEDLEKVIEGDDSLVGIEPEEKEYFTVEAFARFGLRMKILFKDDISETSFCGQIFSPEALDVLADPLRYLKRFGWLDTKYTNATDRKKKRLLRAVAFSLAYQFPRCPILRELALWLLRATRSYTPDWSQVRPHLMHKYGLDITQRTYADVIRYMGDGVHPASRFVVERRFEVPVCVQLSIEAKLRAMDEIQVLYFPEILQLCHPDTIDYFRNSMVTTKDPLIIRTMNPPPMIDYRGVVREIDRRLQHVTRRRLLKSSGKDLPQFCSCGVKCLYKNNVLHGFKKDLTT